MILSHGCSPRGVLVFSPEKPKDDSSTDQTRYQGGFRSTHQATRRNNQQAEDDAGERQRNVSDRQFCRLILRIESEVDRLYDQHDDGGPKQGTEWSERWLIAGE